MGSLRVDNCTDTDNNGFCFAESKSLERYCYFVTTLVVIMSLCGIVYKLMLKIFLLSLTFRTLDVGHNMTVGGLRSFDAALWPSVQINTHNFVGCMRNLRVNGIALRPSTALAAHDIIDG